MSENILIVGSGGLGSELLKLLALNGQNIITIVDDDTIDMTNLNRQFLFTRSDINKSKSIVAKSKIIFREKRANNSLNIRAIYGKINQFKEIEWYKSFDVVYNCLDNNEARSFINQRCHLANVLMIDGGTGGWLGQSFHNGAECFDCLPRKIDSFYPICNIRQKPETFEHCLIWANTIIEESKKRSVQEDLQFLYKLCLSYKKKGITSVKKNSSSIKETKDNMYNPELFYHKKIKYSLNNNYELKTLNNIQFSPKDLESNINTLLNIINIKENEDNKPIDRIYKLALHKANLFKIAAFSFMESKNFIEKIIPSICTTNAIVASLMILSKENKRNFFLVQNSSCFLSVDLNEPNQNCLTCSIPKYLCQFNTDTSVKDILLSFSSSTLILENRVLTNKNVEFLTKLNLNGEFGIVIRNELKHGFYFEFKKDIKKYQIKRIK